MTTLRAGLIGDHISRTRLPAALAIMCAEIGWTLEFPLLDTAEDRSISLRGAIDHARTEDWTGITVTHPWKRDARVYAGDGMVPQVAHLGAANTLVFREARGADMTGFNTDYTGTLAAFEAAKLPVGACLMVGAGGVAEAIGPALLALGCPDLAILDLDGQRAEDLASSIGPTARAIPSEALPEAVSTASGLINATPLGMAEYPGSAIPRELLGGQVWAFDAVYTPTDTEFLQNATDAGLATLTGFELFRHMAIRSFEAYTGVTLDPSRILPKLEVLRP